jgi:hypothetical protein
MRRLAIATLTLLATFAAGLLLVAPVSAQARSVPGSASPDGQIWWFSGYTYPDTSAGYSACVAQGVYERSHDGVATYSCRLGDPDAGLYNLWLADTI